MFFVLSKLLWFAAAPANALVLLIVLGTLLLRFGHPSGWIIGGTALAALVLIGLLPIGTLLLRPLEDRFPQPPADMGAPTGIVVLGGSTDETISAARGQPTVVDAAGRVTAAVELARRFPGARLVFSGGSGTLLSHDGTEAADTRALWIAMGVPAERITVEDRSRNTDENARFTSALVEPKPGDRWLLVTSAYHMPRAMGLFRTSGFPVIPYPVDYRTAGTRADLVIQQSVATGLGRFTLALREWVGLVVYRLTGRTRTLFPEP